MKIFKKLNFNPTNVNLYYEAFTHSSYSNENPSFTSYERLEFLGDAILEFIISDYLYNERHLEEGLMTKLRANYVCEEATATYAKDLHFEEDILLGGGYSNEKPNTAILGDVFEAFVAAMYLDKGLSFTKMMVLKIIVKYIDEQVNFLHDYKTILQESIQKKKQTLTYEITKEEGPDHHKTFECIVKINGKVKGKGIGNSKKDSEQSAAKKALENERSKTIAKS